MHFNSNKEENDLLIICDGDFAVRRRDNVFHNGVSYYKPNIKE